MAEALPALLSASWGAAVRSASAVAVATLGLLAFLLWVRDRSRPDLGLYALLAASLATYLLLTLPGLPAIPPALLAGLELALPVTGFLFVSRFLEVEWSALQWVLLSAPLAAGAVLAGSPDLFRDAGPALIAGSLLLLGGATLVRLLLRRGTDAALLFAGVATLLLAAGFDAAAARHILASPPFATLLGPAFLLFTGLLLVVVAEQSARLVSRATTDALTGLPNRASFVERASRELARAERTGGTLALVMADIDHFKRFNDRYGHQTGDRVLALSGRAIAAAIRGIDLAARYGGEEFVFLLVDVDEESARTVVERVREAIAQLALPNVSEPLTASAGIAMHHGLFEKTTVAGLVKRADAALYEAKRAGRDRVVRANPASAVISR